MMDGYAPGVLVVPSLDQQAATHPVAKNDLTCIVASTATQICEAVRKNITTDASCLKEELNEMYKAVSIDQNAISENYA